MMGRAEKYSKSDVEGFIKIKETEGISIKAQCLAKKIPYISIHKAVKRFGLTVPKTLTRNKIVA